jgi:predicted lipoprotein with Yx(FWY)xxD motif
VANGALADPTGKPLYTYDNDTMKGMSHCRDDCAQAWPPFLAGPSARPVGDWTIIVREGGAQQWAYKDKPLYTFPADKPGAAGTGETAGKFKLAR